MHKLRQPTGTEIRTQEVEPRSALGVRRVEAGGVRETQDKLRDEPR